MNNDFIFTDDPVGHTSGATCVTVLRSVSSKADLLGLLSRGLSFPSTFGANWDALYDCLCDLSWMSEKRVAIAHESVPTLPSDDLLKYLGVLRDAVASWRDNPGVHELIVVFPLSASATLS
jgi:hypothetical protein